MAIGKSSRSNLPAADSKSPGWTSEDIRASLRRYDRSPFLDLLAAWMECAPQAEDVISMAAKKPDVWVRGLSDLAKMSGFTDKQEVIHTHRLDQMSDSQLEDQMRKLATSMGIDLPGKFLTIEQLDQDDATNKSS